MLARNVYNVTVTRTKLPQYSPRFDMIMVERCTTYMPAFANNSVLLLHKRINQSMWFVIMAVETMYHMPIREQQCSVVVTLKQNQQ